MKRGFFRRYLLVVGGIFVVLVALGVWLKPPLENMREGVDEGLRAWAAAHSDAGEPPPAVTHEESHDWIIAASHTARVGEETFSCWGAFKVTVCTGPDGK